MVRSNHLATGLFGVALALHAPSLSAAEPIIGRASVIDGDTIEIRGQRIRLFGIDAPEGGQTDTERRIKGWSRAKKEALIRGDFDALPGLAKRRSAFSAHSHPPSSFETAASPPPQDEG